MKLLLFTLILSTNALAGDRITSVTAKTEDAWGFEKQPLVLKSQHHVTILNPEPNVDMTYEYSYSLCPEAQPCQEHHGSVTLHPGQIFNHPYSINYTVKYLNARAYSLKATTMIYGHYGMKAEDTKLIAITSHG